MWHDKRTLLSPLIVATNIIITSFYSCALVNKHLLHVFACLLIIPFHWIFCRSNLNKTYGGLFENICNNADSFQPCAIASFYTSELVQLLNLRESEIHLIIFVGAGKCSGQVIVKVCITVDISLLISEVCLTGIENSFIKQPTSIDSSIITLHCVNSFFCTNTGQCGPKKFPYLATFHAVSLQIGDYSYLKV